MADVHNFLPGVALMTNLCVYVCSKDMKQLKRVRYASTSGGDYNICLKEHWGYWWCVEEELRVTSYPAETTARM